jgi:hypothetical protein
LTKSKKKPRGTGVSVTPNLRGLLFLDFLRWCKTTGFGPLLTEFLKLTCCKVKKKKLTAAPAHAGKLS